jgi:hypothetical protein
MQITDMLAWVNWYESIPEYVHWGYFIRFDVMKLFLFFTSFEHLHQDSSTAIAAEATITTVCHFTSHSKLMYE